MIRNSRKITAMKTAGRKNNNGSVYFMMKVRAEVVWMLDETMHAINENLEGDEFLRLIARAETLMEVLGTDTPTFQRKLLEAWKKSMKYRALCLHQR